jgi:acyl carrier protein
MNETQLFSLLSVILVDALRVPPEKITAEARLFGDLGAESIDILDIQFRIERAFGLRLDSNAIAKSLSDRPAADIQRDLTVGVVASFINQCLEQQNAS